MYDRFKKNFAYINKGSSTGKNDIFAYNGGLFEEDEILDSIKISDTPLYKHTFNLCNYDFESEVGVNVLGHIFEHSLSEIEEMQSELEGHVIDKSKTKRKKDGVFYTPKYITKYIVDNTLGNLCKSKKVEFEINEEEYELERTVKQNKAKVKVLQGKLEQYRNWLLEVTICDPACGSGAFLNQALDFLITEHRYIDELQAKLFGDKFVFQNIENSILENNIFGVDINDESVEIAKLSLWLRTAQKGRKLTSLNNNIKCGNSLIGDEMVAGDKAFDWKNEFPEVFAKGGFDVVIGNPPYVRVEFISKEDVAFYKASYQSSTGKFDLSSLFVEKGLKIIHKKGSIAFISSYQFLYTNSGIGLRELLSKNIETKFFKFSSGQQLFKGATTYTGIFFFKKSENFHFVLNEASSQSNTVTIQSSIEIIKENLTSQKVILDNTSLFDKILKLENIQLGETIGNSKTGVVSSADDVFFVTKNQIKDLKLEQEIIYPILGSDEIFQWYLTKPDTYCIYPYYQENGKTLLIPFKEIENKYPNVASYSRLKVVLKRFQSKVKY